MAKTLTDLSQLTKAILKESFHPAQPPRVAPELVAAPSVAPPTPREPAAPVTQQGAKRHKPTFVQGKFRW